MLGFYISIFLSLLFTVLCFALGFLIDTERNTFLSYSILGLIITVLLITSRKKNKIN